jgi:hypothetical protein
MRRTLICLMFICLFALAQETRAGLVGWWKLDEGAGQTAVDSSGNGLDGIVTDAAWRNPGYDGTGWCIELDRGGYVDLGNPPALDFATGDWTVTAWINTTIVGNAETERGTVYAKGGDNGGGHRYTICVGEITSGCLTLTCDDDSTKVQATGTTLVNDGEWHLVAGQREGTTIRVAADAVFDGQNTVAATYSLAGTSQHNAYIGAMTSHTDSSLFKLYKGLIDDVRVYDRALTAGQMEGLFHGAAPDFAQAQDPNPPDGDVAVTMPLFQWKAGDMAMFHDVYLGTDPNLRPEDLVQSHSPMAMYYHVPGLTPGTTYYWRVDEIEEDMTTIHTGNVWSFMAQPVTAYLPQPADGAADASTDPNATLTWAAGQNALEHHLYFGDDFEAVQQGAAATDKGTLETLTFTPGALEPLTTYFWRVDEIVAGGAVQTGPVWTFTTSLVVDDFEGYTDQAGEEIFSTWIDGIGQYYLGNTDQITGSTVGHLTAPFAEQTIIHGGRQSMPLDYNNVVAPFYSEAEREFAPAADWTADGADTLVLYVRGNISNVVAPLYVAVEDSAAQVVVMVHPDPAVVKITQWLEWRIPFADLSAAGVNLAKVKKLYLGVGDRSSPAAGGTGLIYVDDIQLLKAAPATP